MSFIEHFAIVDDPRNDINVKHDLLDVLFLIVSALILAQMKSAGKTNEHTSVLTLPDTLNIRGAHVTADAMNSQRKIVNKIIKRGVITLCVSRPIIRNCVNKSRRTFIK